MSYNDEASERTNDISADRDSRVVRDQRRITYRVREIVCTYRPLRNARGRAVRIPTETLKDPRQAASVLGPLVADQTVEMVGIAYLSVRNVCLAWHVVSRGHRAGSMVSIADAFVPACITPGAVGLIVVHNHPSGDPTPSRDDLELTKKLADAASLLDFSLVDHLVIGENGRYYSFRDSNVLMRPLAS